MCDELPIIFLTFETQASAHKSHHTVSAFIWKFNLLPQSNF